jgi:DNA-binding MarR family transcriptional regulator
LYDATVRGGAFPDDALRRFLQRLARHGLLEPQEHAGQGMSLSEVLALGELADDDALSQQELGARLGLEKSTVSRLAAALEGRGWLVRERDPANRRYYRLRLTPHGRDLAEQVGADFRTYHHGLLGALTDEERTALSIGLSALTRVLDDLESSGTRPRLHSHHRHHDVHDAAAHRDDRPAS